jgi:hypothetical protein
MQPLLDYYRIPEGLLRSVLLPADPASGAVGFFQFGLENVCYGRCSSGVAKERGGSATFNARDGVRRSNAGIQLPFDPTEVIDNLRLERYRQESRSGFGRLVSNRPIHNIYYSVRKFLPFPLRRQLQRIYFRNWKQLSFPGWPVDFSVDNLHRELLRLTLEASGLKRLPFIWFWPEGAAGCLSLTHDVETIAGRNFTFKLMELDESFGFKAAYQVIPEERYQVQDEFISGIRNRGCEFNIHDLNHDGNLYSERVEFERRAAEINGYARRYNSQGFRAGVMYRRQDWYDAFEFSYDMSVPNVAHLEPLRGGCCTVMPYFIGKILELPLTTAQDYALFHILSDYSIELWKQQVALIRKRNGLMTFLTHPDYLIEQSARNVYEALLDYLRQFIAQEGIWQALPGEIDRWWRARSQMKLIPCGDGWEIVGPDKERARLAYATITDGRLVYDLSGIPSRESVTP